MALVRVYCGLASADTGVAGDEGWLTAAVVDDSGRLLEVCEIGDDANGYATLSSLLAERSSAPSGVAVAADSDDHLVTMLLTTAGRPLSVVDDDAADDYAERFADDESQEEIESEPAERRAVGLARALQAGALSAQAGPAPRDLAGLKPVLSAHSALTHGRHGAAGALREVLRELYPAALRAYPDPAEPVALTILDLLPEPGLLAAPATGRNRDTALAVDSVAAQVAASGVTDHASALEAVTALRVAIAETPRRGGVTKHLTSAIAETVRQAVAAVRACDAACAALIDSVAARVATPAPAKGRRAATPITPLRAVREAPEPPVTRIPAARRNRAPLAPVSASPVSAEPVSAAPATVTPVSATPVSATPVSATPVSATPVSATPVSATPVSATPVSPAAPLPPGFEPTPAVGVPMVQPTAAQPIIQPAAPQPMAQPVVQPQPVAAQPVAAQPVSAPQPVAQPAHQPQPVAVAQTAVPQPVSGQPMPTRQPQAMPMAQPAANPVPAQRVPVEPEPLPSRITPAETGAPFVPKLSQAAINNARAERLTAPPAEPLLAALDEQGAGAAAAEIVFPLSRPAAPANGGEVPGARSSWPLLGDRDEPEAYTPEQPEVRDFGTGGYDKVTPPWLADDLKLPEPPALRLVDAAALDEPLPGRVRRSSGPDPLDANVSMPDDADGDLLIFSTVRSAWFTGQADEAVEDEPTWNSEMDLGWQAAQHASHPDIVEQTRAGLPKRVPQANLVPGSPIAAPERPLQIVRDPQRLAQHTSGYFRGWRRGQEVNGYAVGGRPGRESAGGWDFSRDNDRDDRDDYGYRTAGYGR
ncbi:transposase [Hamadaea sp. NPDC051192]|uniref:transposase n=1 Tax=Hamadaea sp. NPDC051192 TaxID=3154940 RepID=UPI00342F3914